MYLFLYRFYVYAESVACNSAIMCQFLSLTILTFSSLAGMERSGIAVQRSDGVNGLNVLSPIFFL